MSPARWTENTAADNGPAFHVVVIVTHICGGIYFWEFGRSMSFHISLVNIIAKQFFQAIRLVLSQVVPSALAVKLRISRRSPRDSRRTVSCAYGIILYILCQLTTVASIVAVLAFLYTAQFRPSPAINRIQQVTGTFAVSFALCLLMCRVLSMWQYRAVNVATGVLALGFWAVILRAMIVLPEPWQDGSMNKTLWTALLTVSTLTLVMGVQGMLKVRKRQRILVIRHLRGHAARSVWDLILSERVPLYAAPWLMCAMGMIFALAVPESNELSLFTFGFVTMIVICSCACRAYEHMAAQAMLCPLNLFHGRCRKPSDEQDHNNVADAIELSAYCGASGDISADRASHQANSHIVCNNSSDMQ